MREQLFRSWQDPTRLTRSPRAYSAHEFSTLSTKAHKNAALPLDIKLETLVSVALACFGLVLGSDTLKPVSWSAWAGQIEREGGMANPFKGLEDRVGFMDIRAQRREFANWVRKQDGQK
jgi:membrane magnesium transporter 1